MATLRKSVEDAVIAALEPLKDEDLSGGAAGGYLKKVAAYQGSLAPAPDDPDVRQLIENGTPCIGVCTGDGEYDEFTEGYMEKATLGFSIELLIICGNQRSDEAKARGDTFSADLGIYEILKACRQKLWLDLGVSGAGISRPRRERAIVRGGSDIAIWLASYSIDTDAQQDDPAAAASSYTTHDVEANEPDDDLDDANPVATIRRDV